MIHSSALHSDLSDKYHSDRDFINRRVILKLFPLDRLMILKKAMHTTIDKLELNGFEGILYRLLILVLKKLKRKIAP